MTTARRRPARLAAALLLAVLPGCVYFNGMYNAKKYAHDAERSERAGRTAEARDRWVRAALHAESLTVRHPNSRWVVEARLIRGRALLHLQSYSEAVVQLDRVVRDAPELETRREAALLLGQANLALRRYAHAEAALDSAVLSGVRARRDAAFQARGRARLGMRRPAEALSDFEASSARGIGFDRARVALALGEPRRAASYLESETAGRPYNEAGWLGLLDSLGAGGDDAAASALVDELVGEPAVGAGQRARLLLGDGDRQLRRGRVAAAAARFEAARAAVPDSAEARIARVRLAAVSLRAVESDEDLASARQELAGIEQLGGTAGRDASTVLRFLRRADTLMAVSSPQGAFRFARAELLRDSLGMVRYAAIAFADMADSLPDSPWAPKALIAAIAAGHADSARLTTLLRTRYASSPYAAVARGIDAPGYSVLEDSLRAVLSATAAAVRDLPDTFEGESGLRRRPGAVPATPVDPVRRDVPEPTPGSRNPQP